MTEKPRPAEDNDSSRESRKPHAGEAPPDAERPDGSPQPAHPDHKQPMDAPGETDLRPEHLPGRDPNHVK